MLGFAPRAKPLMSDFKFGFELEGFILVRNQDEAEWRENRYSEYLENFMRRKVQRYMRDFWPSPNMPHSDASLESHKLRKKGRVISFEWPSPVLDMTPSNISKSIQALSGLQDIGVYTNKSCGLHVHMSFPTLDVENAVWLMCHLALDEEQQARIYTMKKKGWFRFGKYDFQSNNFAETDYLKQLSSAILSGRDDSVAQFLNNSKYRVLRIHPQGTLEWRGPRGFLDDGHKKDIHQFFMLLLQFADWMRCKLAETRINGIPKQAFLESIDAKNMDLFCDKPTGKRWHKHMTPTEIKHVCSKVPWLRRAKFRDAHVEYDPHQDRLVWIQGEWLDGVWENGYWHYGTWYNGTWKNGYWRYGLVKNDGDGGFIRTENAPIVED